MKGKVLISILVLVLSTLCVYSQDSRPNVVFILADDLGWADLPVYGNEFNEAPNIERLAEEGMTFTNAYAAAPVCSPTRASIISGQYPARVGITDFITGHWRPYEEVIVPKNRTQYLPQNIYTIGEAMKDAGYATGYFGKWHLGNDADHHPASQGFDDANIVQGYYNSRVTPDREEYANERLSDRITHFGTDFIETNKDNPFFLFLAHYDVHVQLDADNDLINKYLDKEKVDGYPCNAIYAAMIEHIDRSVATVVEKLKTEGLNDNTVVIFFSDNGGLISRFDRIPLVAKSKEDIYRDNPLKYIASSNAPLRSEKGTVYEGGIREPLIVKWPDKIRPGTKSEALVSSVDFFPTLLDLVDAPLPSDQILDGKSLLPEFGPGNGDDQRSIFWHYPVYHHGEPAGAVRKGNWKLIENLVNRKTYLYNLKYDISEGNDLSDLYPDKKQELLSLLKNWQKDVKAEFPEPNPHFDKNRRYEWGIHPDRK